MNSYTDEKFIILASFLLVMYFLPTIIAWRREKANVISIFLLNFFLGWSFFGWIAALIWACTTDRVKTVIVNNTYSNHESNNNHESRTKSRSVYDAKFESLQRLKTLLDSGVLTQEEYDDQKAKILAEKDADF